MNDGTRTFPIRGTNLRIAGRPGAVPPHLYFLVSAVFHYLGPAFAVLLFTYVPVLGVCWIRVASSAVILGFWRRPWRGWSSWSLAQKRDVLALGAVIGLMNASFYLAIARLPLGTVGAIEFLGPIMVAAWGFRTRRNLGALCLCIAGVALLANMQFSGEPIGVAFAAANCGLFTLYIVLGHKVAQNGAPPIDQLAAALAVALLVTTPLGLTSALPAMLEPSLLLAGIGVGICSSVIPYVCDQMAMARLPRASFALMLSLLPATATVVGLIVLGQAPSSVEVVGIGLIILAVAIHQGEVAQKHDAPQL